MMIRHGIRVADGKAYCGDVELSDSALGRAADVDRRVIRSTIERICSDRKMSAVFSKLISIPLFSDAASEIGCSTLEIIPTDATIPGILAEAAGIIYQAGVSIRQAVVDDPGLGKDAHLIIVMDGQLPPEYIPVLKASRGVKQIVIR